MADLRQTLARTENLILAPGRLLLPHGPQPGMAVLIRDGRFHRIGPLGELRAAHSDAGVTELPGHLLMPGFVDTHTHLTQSLGKSLVFGEPSEIFRRIWVPLEGSLDEHMVYLSSKLAALECLVARHFDGGAHLFEARLVEPAFVFDDVLHRVRGLRGDGEGLALCLRLEARGLRG